MMHLKTNKKGETTVKKIFLFATIIIALGGPVDSSAKNNEIIVIYYSHDASLLGKISSGIPEAGQKELSIVMPSATTFVVIEVGNYKKTHSIREVRKTIPIKSSMFFGTVYLTHHSKSNTTTIAFAPWFQW